MLIGSSESMIGGHRLDLGRRQVWAPPRWCKLADLFLRKRSISINNTALDRDIRGASLCKN